MTEHWDTIEAITAARRRFEDAIPGWQPPAAYGVARDTPDGSEFVRVNAGEHGLPAVFAATLTEISGDRYVAALVEAALAGRVENPDGTTTLWRPVGPPDQPIFYPVLSEAYAVRIAREWNVAASGAGYVTRFRVATSCARRYPSRVAGGEELRELWVPAEELAGFNANLVGSIEVVAEFVDTGGQ